MRETAGRGGDLVKFYGSLLAGLEAELGCDGLGRLLKEARAGGTCPAAPATSAVGERRLAPCDSVIRMLTRVGAVRGGTGCAQERADQALAFITATAKAVSRPPTVVVALLRAHAIGVDAAGRKAAAVCGRLPRCRGCSVARLCDYFNAPRRPPARARPLVQRLQQEPAANLSDVELLTLLLGGTRPTKRERAAAEQVVERFGDIRGVLAAGYDELASLRQVSPAAAARLAAAGACQRRAARQVRGRGAQMRCAGDFFRFYHPRLRDRKQEVFITVMLDQKHRFLRDVQVSVGTLTASLVHPREVFRPAIQASAAAVAFIHNHPSGDPAPSADDLAVTRRLRDTAELVGIRMLDHVIIGENAYHSFAEAGSL